MATSDNNVINTHMTMINQQDERNRLTREALEDVDRARVIDHLTVLNWAESLSTDKPLRVPK